MKTRLIALLRSLLAWLEGPVGAVVVDAVLERVRERVREANETSAAGTSGAYKKWQLVAPRVAKEFPDVPLKRINFLIETVLQETK
jgi:hypothetical protein